jgi:hypothetical protein
VTMGRHCPRSRSLSKRIVLLIAFALTFCAGVIVSKARHHFGAPRFTPAATAEPDVLDLVAALRAKGIRLEPVATAPYRSLAKAAYLCAEVPPLDTFARLMRSGEGLGNWQGIVFVDLHGSALNIAATVIGPYHLWLTRNSSGASRRRSTRGNASSTRGPMGFLLFASLNAKRCNSATDLYLLH